MIVPLSAPYLRSIAEVHVTLDPTGFLNQEEVGVTFREKIYYPTLLADLGSFVWIFLVEEKLAGYVAGTIDIQKLYQRLKDANFGLLLKLLAKTCTKKPKLILEFVNTKRRLEQSYLKESTRAEILSLGVLPEYRSEAFERTTKIHVATALFKKAVETFRDRGITQFKVMTTQENEAANHFYEKQGCQRIGVAVPFHLPCNVYLSNTSRLSS